MAPMSSKVAELRTRRATLLAGGGPERVERQHRAGKWTARERVEALLDQDTFQELHLFASHRCTRFGMAGLELPGDGVVTGVGAVGGRQVAVASQDFTVAGGSVGEVHASKIAAVQDYAMKVGAPLVLINDSGGARIQEGIDALSGYGRIFHRNVLLSGVVPQIAVVAGPCAGGAAYSPALMDFVVMVEPAGRIFITGPGVIREVTGEVVTDAELGGADAQEARSGVVHLVAGSDEQALSLCKELLSYLPSNNLEDPPDLGDGEVAFFDDGPLEGLVPADPRQGYDVRDVVRRVVDRGELLELQARFAPNVVVGFARIDGKSMGVVANQPLSMAGALDIDASDKVAGFVRFCDAFNLPLVTFVDVPGFLPGVAQEHGGIIRHGAKVLFAYSAATVPKVTVILRKAYGGAYIAMCAKDLGADRVAAWPSAEVAVMGAAGAVRILRAKEIEAAPDPEEARARFAREYDEELGNPWVGAARSLIDDVIEPGETRRYLSLALESLRTKRETRPGKKHGLIPL